MLLKGASGRFKHSLPLSAEKEAPMVLRQDPKNHSRLFIGSFHADSSGSNALPMMITAKETALLAAERGEGSTDGVDAGPQESQSAAHWQFPC